MTSFLLLLCVAGIITWTILVGQSIQKIVTKRERIPSSPCTLIIYGAICCGQLQVQIQILTHMCLQVIGTCCKWSGCELSLSMNETIPVPLLRGSPSSTQQYPSYRPAHNSNSDPTGHQGRIRWAGRWTWSRYSRTQWRKASPWFQG